LNLQAIKQLPARSISSTASVKNPLWAILPAARQTQGKYLQDEAQGTDLQSIHDAQEPPRQTAEERRDTFREQKV